MNLTEPLFLSELIDTHRYRVSFEFRRKTPDIDEITGERCVMIREVPFPGCTALVVVAKDPTQASHVLKCYGISK